MIVSLEVFFFLILALGAITGAVLFLFFSKVVHALLSSVLTFVSLAGFYIMLSAEFIAGAQILIYSGAITILLLFAVMLTKKDDVSKGIKKGWTILVTVTTFTFACLIYYGISDWIGKKNENPIFIDNTKEIGTALFTKFIIPFELVSMLLLVALIGSILLAKRNRES
mgnify:CR=1 FL=1